MSIFPEYKKCAFCGKKFSFNPSVGNIKCPYCGALFTPSNPSKKKKSNKSSKEDD